jgi:hypothetical protein
MIPGKYRDLVADFEIHTVEVTCSNHVAPTALSRSDQASYPRSYPSTPRPESGGWKAKNSPEHGFVEDPIVGITNPSGLGLSAPKPAPQGADRKLGRSAGVHALRSVFLFGALATVAVVNSKTLAIAVVCSRFETPRSA